MNKARGQVAQALVLFGLLTAGTGLYLYGDNVRLRLGSQRQSDAMVERVMDGRAPEQYVREAEDFLTRRIDNLRQTTAEGAQQGLNLELMPTGNFGEAVSHVFTAQDFSEAARDYGETFRSAPSPADAALYALRKRNLRSLLERQELPHVPAMERSLMRQYDQLINKERSPIGYEEFRKRDPAAYARLSDDEILEVLASSLVKQKVREMKEFVDETRRDLEKSGLQVTSKQLEQLLDIRYSQGRVAFDRAVQAAKDQGRKGGFQGEFRASAAPVSGRCFVELQGQAVSGRFEGYQELDKGFPEKVSCSFEGKFAPVSGKFEAPLKGRTTVRWILNEKVTVDQLELTGTVHGKLQGSKVEGTWSATYRFPNSPKASTLEGSFSAQK